MNEHVTFFAPECPAAILTAVGGGWEFQNQNAEQRSKDYINELGRHGDETARKLVNGKTATGWQFLSKHTSGNIIAPPASGQTFTFPVGGVIGGYHIDSIEIGWDRGQLSPKLTILGHAHDGVTGGHNVCRTYSPTVTIAVAAFGIPADLGAVALSSEAEVDFRSATYRLAVSHIDETGRSGNQLKGDNHDGVETMNVEFTGDADADDYEIEDGWSAPNSGRTPSNTGVTTSSLELVHHISADVHTSPDED